MDGLVYGQTDQQIDGGSDRKSKTTYPGYDKSKFDLLVWQIASARKTLKIIGFPYIIYTFFWASKKFFALPSKNLTCPGQLDNRFVRP